MDKKKKKEEREIKLKMEGLVERSGRECGLSDLRVRAKWDIYSKISPLYVRLSQI
jgi:hypothetical protein